MISTGEMCENFLKNNDHQDHPSQNMYNFIVNTI